MCWKNTLFKLERGPLCNPLIFIDFHTFCKSYPLGFQLIFIAFHTFCKGHYHHQKLSKVVYRVAKVVPSEPKVPQSAPQVALFKAPA